MASTAVSTFSTFAAVQAVAVNALYDFALESVLRVHNWSFAATRVSLVKDNDAPAKKETGRIAGRIAKSPSPPVPAAAASRRQSASPPARSSSV